MKRISAFLLAIVMLLAMSACSTESQDKPSNGSSGSTDTSTANSDNTTTTAPENFVLIKGGTFAMGIPRLGVLMMKHSTLLPSAIFI